MGGPRVLLVTAHPDDESMFFVPAVRSAVQGGGAQLALLCLSRGNAQGMGQVREREVRRVAGQLLGVQQVGTPMYCCRCPCPCPCRSAATSTLRCVCLSVCGLE